MGRKRVRITHIPSNTLIAEGPIGWAITPFEGNLYIRKREMATKAFRTNYLPGFCVYKFLYVWLDFVTPGGAVTRNLGWKYWFPNPLLPFIWFRVAVSRTHPAIRIEEYYVE